MPPVTPEQLTDLRRDLQAQVDDLKLISSQISVDLKTKVDKEQFFWIIGILMTIVLGLFGVIYAKLNDVGLDVNKTQVDVSFIQGKLQAAEVTNK